MFPAKIIQNRFRAIGLIHTSKVLLLAQRSAHTYTTDDPKEHFRESTVDTQEIENLSKKACDWWKRDGELKGLRALNELRVPFIRDNLIHNGQVSPDHRCSPYPLKDLHILDLGCGGGILAEPLARIGATVTGLDASEELIHIAKTHSEKDPEIQPRLDYVCESIENFASHHIDSYDAIVCSEVLEHVTKKDVFLEHAVDTLKPGGSIFFTTFSKNPMTGFAAILLGEYIFRAAPIGTHEYEKFINPSDLQRILEKLNCRVEMIHGMMYNPFSASWSWNGCQISYALHAVKEGKEANEC